MKVAIFYNKKNLLNQTIISIDGEYTLLAGNYLNLTNEGYIYPLSNLISKLSHDIEILEHAHLDHSFVVGQVVECSLVPNTHLNLCKVNVGKEILQIICGANNVTKDIKVVVALAGTAMPNGDVISKSKLMNHESNGMICSSKELGLHVSDENSRGIMILTDEYNIGEEYKRHYSGVIK